MAIVTPALEHVSLPKRCINQPAVVKLPLDLILRSPRSKHGKLVSGWQHERICKIRFSKHTLIHVRSFSLAYASGLILAYSLQFGFAV